MDEAPPRALLIYHFFHPDNVVSARLFSDLALGLREKGWEVTALTSDRAWADPRATYAAREIWQGVAVERAHRPPWDQAKPLERLGNSAWMLGAWLARAASMKSFDAVVLGSDPAFAALLFVPLRSLWPRSVFAHWCYDLYPEAIVADGAGRAVRGVAAAARKLMKAAYKKCDAVVDLGPRMRERLSEYGGHAEHLTITPWALVEPDDAPSAGDERVRKELFGDARVGLLYSGTLGRAHDFRTLLDLARVCRKRTGDDIVFCFAGRGARLAELRGAIEPGDTNVRIAPFCEERDLGARLEAADVHLMSLQPAWSGLVVPSKFFGSLAVGRPMVYAGARDSDVARWIDALDVGRVVTQETLDSTAAYLESLAASPGALRALQLRARRAYDEQFRKERGVAAWDALLRRLTRREG
jgi:colanic acid biosynthesis glycosyl transferase WcaI